MMTFLPFGGWGEISLALDLIAAARVVVAGVDVDVLLAGGVVFGAFLAVVFVCEGRGMLVVGWGMDWGVGKGEV
jgi:hypothetical protein